jgi:hypothetical protein
VQTILADHTEGNLHLASQVEDRICEITPCLPKRESPFNARKHDRATRAVGVSLAAGSFTTGTQNSVDRMREPANARTTEITTAAPPTNLCIPKTLVGTTGSSGTKPEFHPKVLPTAERFPPSKGLPPQRGHRHQETSTGES